MTSLLRRLLVVLLIAAGWSGAAHAQSESPAIDSLVSQFISSNGLTVVAPTPANPDAFDNFDASQPAQIDLSGLEITATSQIRLAPDSLPFTRQLLDWSLGPDSLAVLGDLAVDGSLYGLGNLIADQVIPRSFGGNDAPDRPLFDEGSILDQLNRALADVSTPELLDKAQRLATELERLTGAGAVFDELFGPGGVVTCGGAASVNLSDGEHIVSCLGPADSLAFINGADVLSMQVANVGQAAVNNFEVELVIGIVRPAYPIYNGSFAGDLYNGTNENYGFRLDNSAGTFQPFHVMWDGASWSDAPSDSIIVLSNDTMTLWMPQSAEDPLSIRYNTFAGQFQGPGGVGSYSVPNPGEPPMLFAPSIPTAANGFMPPTAETDFLFQEVFDDRAAASTTTTSSTTTSTIEAAVPAATTLSTETDGEGTDGETSDDDTNDDDTNDDDTNDDDTNDDETIDDTSDGDGVNLLGVGLLGVGVLGAVIGGWLLLAGKKDPCDDERRAYLAAKKACEDARAEARGARQAADDATIDIDRIGKDLDDLAEEWPPAGWSGDGDETSIEFTDAAGGGTDRWTSHVGREWRKHQMDRWREGEISGEDATRIGNETPSGEFLAEIAEVDADYTALRDELETELAAALAANPDAAQAEADAVAAEQRAEAACAAVPRVKAALDACEEKASQPDPEPEPEGPAAPPTRPGTIVPPPTGPTSTQPRQDLPCQIGDEPPPPIIVDTFDKTPVVDFTLRVQPVGYRQGEEAQTLGLGLGQAAAYVDALAAAASGAGAIRKVGAGQVGLAGAEVGGVATGIPTSPVDVGLSIVRMTAQLGSIVATSVGRWLNEHHEMYLVHSVMYEQHVVAMWRDEFECIDGSWQKSRVFEYSIGEVTKRTMPDEEVLYGELRDETRGRLRMMRNSARTDARSFGAFAQSGGGR